MTSMTTSNLFPGMGCDATEFLVVNEELKFLNKGKILPFCELSSEIISVLENAINNDIQVKLELHDWFPNSKMKRTEQFAKCRFGGLDFKADVFEGKLQEGEYWACPNRGNCPSEGILCKMPHINGQRLTKKEVDMIQMLCTDATNEYIAYELDLPMGSFHKFKQNLYQKLKVQTKQEIVRIAFQLNLIQL
jgi:DNA-binding CsgD family transcriptional regulator